MRSMRSGTPADALIRTTCALSTVELRAAYLCDRVVHGDVAWLASVFDVVCERAEQADPNAREVLIPLVDALNHPSTCAAVQRLREQACGVPHLALSRLLRQGSSRLVVRALGKPENDRVPMYAQGRELSVGERKALARRPDRSTIDRLFRDPHPDVIRVALAGPKVREDDVIALAARRPCRPDVLVEVARVSRWVHRPRIRMALILNPDTPVDVTAKLLGLLMRHELRLVATSPAVSTHVRALAVEHFRRRIPVALGILPPTMPRCTELTRTPATR
jgi:hypothetical protein